MNQIPVPEQLSSVPALFRQDSLDHAWQILETHADQHQSLEFIYVWQATILIKQKNYPAALSVIEKGMKTADTRHALHYQMGKLHFETGRMDLAADSWVHCIRTIRESGAPPMWEPFLYLAYVARGCGDNALFQQMMQQVEKISPRGALSLEPDVQERIYHHLDAADTAPDLEKIRAVLQETAAPPDRAAQPVFIEDAADAEIRQSAVDAEPGSGFVKQVALIAGIFLGCILIAWILWPAPEKKRSDLRDPGSLPPAAESSPQASSRRPPEPARAKPLLPEPTPPRPVQSAPLDPAPAPTPTEKRPDKIQAPREAVTPEIPENRTDQALEPSNEDAVSKSPKAELLSVPHKKRLPWLKPKTKTVLPGIRQKDQTGSGITPNPEEKG